MIRTRRLLATATIGAFLLTGAAACGSSGGSDSSGDTAKTTVADSNYLSGDSVVLFAADQDQATEADITDDAKATISADGSSMDPAELQVEAGTIFGFIGEDGLGIDGVIIGCAGGQTLPPATTIGFVITEPGTYPVSLDVAGTELGTVVVS